MHHRIISRRLRRSSCVLILLTAATVVFADPGVATADSAPAITSADSALFTIAVAGTFTVTTTGVPAPAINDGGGPLPTGLTFTDNGDGTATLGGTPAAGTGGTYPVTITASNGIGSDAVQSFTLTVDQSSAITSPVQATFTAGAAGTFTVTTTGVPAPAINDGGGPLPTGLTFTDNGDGTATLGGTPAAGTGGTYPVTITASNGIGSDAVQSLTIVVLAPSTLTFTVSPVTVSGPVTYQVEVSGALGTANGSVSVSDGLGGMCTAVLSGGQGSCAITEHAASSPFTVTAEYAGDNHYAGTQTTVPVVAAVAVAGSAMTETNQIQADASNGDDDVDTVTEAFYSADPVAALSGGSAYFEVAVSPGAQFSSVLITDCNAVNASTLLDWWNPTAGAWQPVAGDPGPQFQSKSDSCLSVVLDVATSSPTLAQLAGSTFATVTYPGATKAPKFVSKASTTCRVNKTCVFIIKTSGVPKASISGIGALPPGMTLSNEKNGRARLAGTPASGSQGKYTLTLTAANGRGTLRRSFVLTVKPSS